MFQGLLLIAAGLRAVDDVVGNLVRVRPNKKYVLATVTSELVLTTEELVAWNEPDTDVDTRVAIYKRGLLRFNISQKVQEVA
jgi:hypothetical protein